MAQLVISEAECEDSLFKYSVGVNSENLLVTIRTTSESVADNTLIDSLGARFFSSGTLSVEEVSERLATIKAAFEDASGNDEELIRAIEHSEFTLINFLLNVAVSNGRLDAESQDTAAKCLAFAGDIHSGLWVQYAALPTHLLLVLRGCMAAALRLGALIDSLPARTGPNEHGGYLGFDERDVADYDMEGYGGGAAQQASDEGRDRVPLIQEATMVWLLFLFQAFSQPLPALAKKVVSCRARKSISGRCSSRRALKASQAPAAELTTDVFGADTVLDNLDVVAFFTELGALLLGLLLRRGLAEDAHANCVKVVALANAQLPRLQQTDTNEIAGLFVSTDCGQPGENLSQDLLHLLNEVGYPHIHGAETLAVVRMCKDVLNVEQGQDPEEEAEGEGYGEGSACSASPRPMEGHFARGHFYTNDVKVMVDIVVRELSNIPHNSSGLTSLTLDAARGGKSSSRSHSTAEQIADVLHGNVRFAYLELLDALVSKSTWSSQGDCYMKDALRGLLQEAADRPEDQRAQLFAQDLLSKYAYYLN